MTTNQSTPTVDAGLDRAETIARIRRALRQRSGLAWSVTGDRGTAWAWITIHVPPARRDEYDAMCRLDQARLARLMGVESVHAQGYSVEPGQAHRRDAVARAETGRPA